MARSKKSILLTGAGGSGTLEIISALKKIGGYRIIGLDASPYARGFALCDVGYVVPLAVNKNFKAAVKKILQKERPDFAVPLVDEEILPFHDLAAELGLKLLVPNREFCVITLDKWKTYLALSKAGLPTPVTILASEASTTVFPAVIKPREGRGSRELGYLDNTEDLEKYLQDRKRSPENYVIQRRVFGKEYTVSAVVGLDGEFLAAVPKEVVAKKGITQVGVTRKEPVIDKLCRDIQESLRANGPFNVQLILQKNGAPMVLEINPRYSTTVALTLASGINEVLLVIRHALGEKVKPRPFKPDLLMFRYQTQVFLPEKNWPPKHVAECL